VEGGKKKKGGKRGGWDSVRSKSNARRLRRILKFIGGHCWRDEDTGEGSCEKEGKGRGGKEDKKEVPEPNRVHLQNFTRIGGI